MIDNKDLLARIVSRARSDVQFRSALMADPRMTVERELGIMIPPGVTVRVVEERVNEIHVVLPPADPEPPATEEIDFDVNCIGW